MGQYRCKIQANVRGNMKKVLLVLAVLSLTACGMLPSKWDANQSRSITDIQLSARHFDCTNDIQSQSVKLQSQIEWFNLYAESRGTSDMLKLTTTMGDTVKELVDRSGKGKVSSMYCDMKKKILIQQSDIISKAVQGRFQ